MDMESKKSTNNYVQITNGFLFNFKTLLKQFKQTVCWSKVNLDE